MPGSELGVSSLCGLNECDGTPHLALFTMSLNGVPATEGFIRLCSTAVYPNKSYESPECCEGGCLTRISYWSTVTPRTWMKEHKRTTRIHKSCIEE